MNPDRRDFLKRTMAVAAGLGVWPTGTLLSESPIPETPRWIISEELAAKWLYELDILPRPKVTKLVSGEIGRFEGITILPESEQHGSPGDTPRPSAGSG